MSRTVRTGSSPRRNAAEFLRAEAAGGTALFAATAVALIWANLDASGYSSFWSSQLALPGPDPALTLHGWVNDGLMAFFFFVVGLEIKREFVSGELRDRRTAAVPIAAAIGGMVVPALVFVAVTAGTDDTRAWGIPMATDIAFAVGVLSLAGGRAASRLSLTLLTLAIVDDLGAILVIAVVYSDGVVLGWLAAAAGIVALVIGLRRLTSSPWFYVVPAIGIWVCMVRSGVHATIAGVIVAGLTPLADRHGRPVLRRLEHRVHPWSTFVVLPIFALANAGIVINSSTLEHAVNSRLAWAIFLGLVVGKPIGIAAAAAIAHRGSRGSLTSPDRVALGLLGGIGFTVALFISELALEGPSLEVAKLAIVAGSLGAGMLAVTTLRVVNRRESHSP